MSRAATETYSGTSMVLHWLSAVVVLVLLVLGFVMTSLETDSIALKYKLYQLHKSFGVLLLAVTLVRIGWRVRTPPPAPITSVWLHRAGMTAHWALYGILVAMPLIGWLMVSASSLGIPTEVFGLFELPHLPLPDGGMSRNELEHLFEEIHESMAFLLIALLVLHVGAGLYHHFIRRDATLLRMVPGTGQARPDRT